jgi:uncharacterized protein YqgC (DUF456 family)
MVDILLLTLGIVLIILGFIGCILPVLPGPPISFLALISINYSKWGTFDSDLLWMLGGIAVAVTILDYIVPIWGTKKFGGSKRGMWGATIGLFIGLFLGIFGIISGPFLGAFLGELSLNNNSKKAFKAALGALIGFFMGVGMKLLASGIITYYFIEQII